MFRYVNLRSLSILLFLVFAVILGVLSTQLVYPDSLTSSTQTSPTKISPNQTSKAINTPWLSVSGRYIKDPAEIM